MANITRRWKRILAVGCSHGHLADPKAVDAVLKFKAAWKPDTTVHLGDFIDMAAFMSGAKGTNNESQPLAPDVDCGLQFLRDLRPNITLGGNHEDRLWTHAKSSRAIVQECAQHIIEQIHKACAGIRCEFIPYNGVWAYKMIGGYRYMHGVIFNENATRDHAERFGNVVHADTHRCAMAKGRRQDNPTGFCVGTLTNVPAMQYANRRTSTLAWSAGFVWGEYCDDASVLWLHEQPQGVKEWRLPSV